MDKRAINPSPWLLQFGINHGVEVTGSQRTLYLSGQTSTASDGTPMHEGDLAAQFKLAWENIAQALKEAGMEPGNIVRLNIYTTDVDALMSKGGELFGLISASGCKPTATLLGVARLYDPTIMVELEATAVA
jgi:enamine deaminase RidA (YjgF/YER057c/UK114 family)